MRKIRGEPEPLVVEAEQLRGDLVNLAAQMIAQLDWRDFEIMVDLIFARGGWQRVSALGEDEVDCDLLLANATIDEVAWVQIKSTARQKVLDDYLERYRRDDRATRFYFICHTPKGSISLPEEPAAHIWSGDELARRALASGLFDWLIDRTR